MVNPLYLDMNKIQLYGFSHEGSKSLKRINFFRELIRNNEPITPVWVGKIDDVVYQLLNFSDVPHLSTKNLALL
jgi:hypothetical protein